MGASTEPRSFERGNVSSYQAGDILVAGFNGAAFFRTRKLWLVQGDPAQARVLQRSRVLSNAETPGVLPHSEMVGRASTEPRSFERGNRMATAGKSRAAWLQRSRVLSNAETIRNPEGGARYVALQRSRVLSNAETVLVGSEVAAKRVASTEPRSFERGNPPWSEVPESTIVASTEPRSFERGNSAEEERADEVREGFNGAAFFRTRKPAGSSATPTVAGRLQRSRVLSNAETRQQIDGLIGRIVASTEPRSFERGNPHPVRCSSQRHPKLQRSRVLSNAETPHKCLERPAYFQLQRSRVLSNAETGERKMIFARETCASTEPRSFERGNH